jgi:hypothetical protein
MRALLEGSLFGSCASSNLVEIQFCTESIANFHSQKLWLLSCLHLTRNLLFGYKAPCTCSEFRHLDLWWEKLFHTSSLRGICILIILKKDWDCKIPYLWLNKGFAVVVVVIWFHALYFFSILETKGDFLFWGISYAQIAKMWYASLCRCILCLCW